MNSNFSHLSDTLVAPKFTSQHSLIHTHTSKVFSSGTNHHPDFSLAMNQYTNGSLPLPTHAIAAFIEIKKDDFKMPDICQVLEYGRHLLLDQPRRARVFVALCNNTKMQWFSVGRQPFTPVQIVYEAYNSVSIASEEGIIQLLTVMSSGLDFAPPFSVQDPKSPHVSYFAETYLGSGAFAVVYGALSSDPDRKKVVLKTYRKKAHAQVETRALHILTGLTGIPTLLFGNVSYNEQWVNCIEPVAASLDRNLKAEEVVELIDILKCVHEQGCICRDVRPANIMLAQDRPILVDWNAAMFVNRGSRKSDPTREFAGTLMYASNSLLKAMVAQTTYEYTAADDLIALSRVVLSQVRKDPFCLSVAYFDSRPRSFFKTSLVNQELSWTHGSRGMNNGMPLKI